MAINPKQPLPLQPVGYTTDIVDKCSWNKIPGMEEYWLVSYKGAVFAELFLGKSGNWFGIIYDKDVVYGKSLRLVEMVIAGYVLNPRS